MAIPTMSISNSNHHSGKRPITDRHHPGIVICLSLLALAQLAIGQTGSESLHRLSQIEERRELLLEEIRRNALDLMDDAARVSGGFWDVGPALGPNIGDVNEFMELMKEAHTVAKQYKTGNPDAGNRATELAFRVTRKVGEFVKTVGPAIQLVNLVDSAQQGYRELAASVKVYYSHVSHDRRLKGELVGLTEEASRLRQELRTGPSNGPLSPSNSAAASPPQPRSKSSSRYAVSAEERSPNTNDMAALDEAIELLDYLDKGDRAFEGRPEEFRRFLRKYPNLAPTHQEAATEAPGVPSASPRNRKTCSYAFKNCNDECSERFSNGTLSGNLRVACMFECEIIGDRCLGKPPSAKTLRNVERYKGMDRCSKESRACGESCRELEALPAFRCNNSCVKAQEACYASLP